jgi:hypothetical protein
LIGYPAAIEPQRLQMFQAVQMAGRLIGDLQATQRERFKPYELPNSCKALLSKYL